MLLVIHGSPETMFGVDWYHEFQVYAASNPRGSAGYGQDFQRGIKNNWGGIE